MLSAILLTSGTLLLYVFMEVLAVVCDGLLSELLTGKHKTLRAIEKINLNNNKTNIEVKFSRVIQYQKLRPFPF